MTQAQTKKPLGICETVLRDSHQSLLATRMRTEDMVPAMEMLDDIGYWSLEVWGGATFDACMRFLNEDPWERLRIMRKRMPKTRLQMLLRGQVVVGYRHYADDVVERFVAKAVENGMQVFRIFDAMNDIRNMETAMRMVRKYGGHVQASVCYTLSPVHNNQGFVKTFKQLLQIGADSLCIKDMGGLISPGDAFDLVTRLKAVTEVPISLHSHYTSGMASMAYFKAAEAGVDMLDCAISSMSLGSSQPPRRPSWRRWRAQIGPRVGPGQAVRDRETLRQGAKELQPPRNEDLRGGYQCPAVPGPGRDDLQPGQSAPRTGPGG